MLDISELKKKLTSVYYNNSQLRILYKNHVSSTNDYLKYKYARDLYPLLVITNNQRAARGRNNKTWVSLNQKSISFSLCFRVNTSFLDLRYLSYLSCVCLMEAIKVSKDNNNEIKIKWPNDIYLNNKKVSGILIESISIDKEVHVSIGVGININIPGSYLVEQPHSNLDKDINQAVLIHLFCQKIFQKLNQKNTRKIIELYNKNLFWYQDAVVIKDGSNYIEGKLLGIDQEGQLMIQNNGQVQCISNIDSTMRRL